MGFYGWSQWNKGNNKFFIVNTWSGLKHFYAISLVFDSLNFIRLIYGISYTDAALPFFDAFVTWGAVIATYMVAKKLIESGFIGL